MENRSGWVQTTISTRIQRMEITIAYCGLDCAGCPIHLATQEQNFARQHSMRAEITRLCSEQYGINLLPHDVTDCDGCRAQSGRLFSGCAKCEIRKCAAAKNLASCAFCAEYACEMLLRHFKTDPAARTRLEVMRGHP